MRIGWDGQLCFNLQPRVNHKTDSLFEATERQS